MKIAIRFGDNDFGNTFEPLLKLLLDAYKHNGNLPEDKNKLCFIINYLSPIIYLTHQNQYEYNGLQNVSDGIKTEESEEFLHTKQYLQITPDRILINEEVTDYIKSLEDEWDNGETFILDTEKKNRYNKEVYSI